MKPYGLPRVIETEYPDKLDITLYGLAPGKYEEKRKSKSKRRIRRFWKKRHRSKEKQQMKKDLAVL